MNEPHYEPMQGIRAVMVDGAENLLRQGEYYIAQGQLVMKCPACRVDNLMPKSCKFKTANWFERLLGRNYLTTQGMRCYHCEHGILIARSQISITKEPIHG